MNKYNYLFIDLDDTIFDSRSLYGEAIEFSWEHLRKFHDVDLETFQSLFLEVRAELKSKYKYFTISHNRAVLFEIMLERLKIKFDALLIEELYKAYWFSVNVHIQPLPTVIETLDKIRQTNIKIVAISDGSLLSRLEKINALRMSKYFDYLVTSEEVVMTKPESPIFEKAMEKTGAKKPEVLFVGNSYSTDVIGGESFGIDSVWFNPEKLKKPKGTKFIPHYEIKKFSELLGILF